MKRSGNSPRSVPSRGAGPALPAGDIAGSSTLPGSGSRAFRWVGGVPTELPVPYPTTTCVDREITMGHARRRSWPGEGT